MNALILPLRVWLLAGLCCGEAGAEMITARSYSGQFLAREFTSQGPAAAPQALPIPVAGGWAFLLEAHPVPSGTNESKIILEPAVLVVSCERLKEILLGELGLADHWQGRIDLTINPALAEEDGPQLKGGRDWSGWNYELELPKRVPARILEQALVQTLLLELVNRKAGGRSAEIPIWLIDGLSAHLEAYNLPTFMLQPGVQTAASNVRMEGSDLVRDQLRRHPPLSFQQLSWPQAADLTGDGLKLYRSCAQLFLEGLLEFPDGKDCLRAMLAQLPEHLNWQTAFLPAFQTHFGQLLDVEKWWGLTAVRFTETIATTSWDAAQAWKKLQSALEAPAAVHFEAGRLPVEALYTLQEVIAQWPPAEAGAAVERAIVGVQSLPARNSPELSLLTALYLKTLRDYLTGCRAATHPPPLGKDPPSLLQTLKANTIKQLDILDRQRDALRPKARPHDRQLSSAQNPAPGARH